MQATWAYGHGIRVPMRIVGWLTKWGGFGFSFGMADLSMADLSVTDQ